VNVADNIARHALFQIELDQTFFRHEMPVSPQNDFPHIPPGKRMAVFEPRDHVCDKLLCYPKKASLQTLELGTFVAGLDQALTFGDDLLAANDSALFAFPFNSLFKLELADELLGRGKLALYEFVFGLEIDDTPEISYGELRLEDLEIARRATGARDRTNARWHDFYKLRTGNTLLNISDPTV